MPKSATDFDAYFTSYPDFPKKGILFRDISPLLASPEGMAKAVSCFIEILRPFDIDIIAGIESRGFLFSTLLASHMDIGSIMIRKPGKLPGELVKTKYELEYGASELTMQHGAGVKSQNVLIVDDLLATGGTISAAKTLLISQQAKVIGCAVVIELTALGGREVVNLPVAALQSYSE